MSIPRLLQNLKTTLYHSPYYLMPYWPGIPTLLTMYDIIPLRYPQYVSIQARLLFRWTTTLALRAATHITSISQATSNDLMKTYGLSSKKITTIPLAVGANFQPQSSEKITAFQTRLALPKKYILYLGSNKPHKNLVRLVEAWAKIQPQSISLIIAGVWDKRYPEAHHKAKTLGLEKTIHFAGPINEADMPTLYSGATAFIFPSEYEGFGLPVLEAMACGVPVACANTSSLPEVAGDAALFFEPTDVSAIAQVLDRLVSDTNLQTNLRERSLFQSAQFSWEQTAQKTLNLYRKMTK